MGKEYFGKGKVGIGALNGANDDISDISADSSDDREGKEPPVTK